MLLPGRHGEESSQNYRYGFQGQEMDDEIKGEGNSANYKYRMHDPRIGRFFAVDPLTSQYPHYTPYSFSGNEVIHTFELEGLEPDNSLLTTGNVGNNYEAQDHTTEEKDVFNWKVVDNDGVLGFSRGSEITGPTMEEAARISNDVYSAQNHAIGHEVRGAKNWKFQKAYIDNVSGYKAALYQGEIDGVFFYVLATAGTEDAFKDGGTDLDAGIGLDALQIDPSIRDAKRVSEYVRTLDYGNKLTFVGHSLGGGLASMNSRVTGDPAITFNAMGISYGVRERLREENVGLYGSKIDAYVIYGEILNRSQRLIGLKAEGNIHYVYGKNALMNYETFKGLYIPMADLPYLREMEAWTQYQRYALGVRISKHSITNFYD